jgi:hypothetical protein
MPGGVDGRRGPEKLEIRLDPRKGRCVVACAAIAVGELIERAPVIVLSAADCRAVDGTLLGHYYFHWDGDFEGDGRGAVPLGLAALCNHAPQPSARVARDLDGLTMDLVALRPIAPGQEITIDYGCALWFDPVEEGV